MGEADMVERVAGTGGARPGKPLTVVQVTPSLGIGGVETYLCRLSEGLIRRGHRVLFLLEEEGTYAARARRAGAELRIVLFGRAGVRQAAESLRGLGVDLVHAHNYRAARFAGPVARRLRLAYLMTVHGPRPWWKRAFFRDWSDTVLTVSEADRDGLDGPFGVDPEDVVVTFLGVDTDRFRPGIDATSLRRAWSGFREGPLIVNVSRFSHRKARVARCLLRSLPEVRRRVPGTRAVLVGDGPELDRIRARADALSREEGEPVAIVVGPRTDIPGVMNAADLVVATATTALEAMSCGVPTIAFGRTGYFGPVGPENLDRARAVCFGDHGRLPPGDDRELAEDLVSLLADPEAAREKAAAVRAEIVRRFSLERMAVHMEGLYREIVDQET